MFSFKLPLFILLAVPAAVSACEGECIVGITNAWLGNYTARLDAVFNNIVRITSLSTISADLCIRPPILP